MTELHMKPNILASVNASVKSTNKMFDSSVDPEGLLCLAVSDSLGKTSPLGYTDNTEYFRERLKIFYEYMSRPYVLGQDLIDAGLKPGKNFSEYLDYAHKLRLAGVEKDSALKQTLSFAKSKIKKEKTL